MKMTSKWIFMDAGDTFVYGYPALYQAIYNSWQNCNPPSLSKIEKAVCHYRNHTECPDFTSQENFQDYFQNLYQQVLQELSFPGDIQKQSLILWNLWESGEHLRLFDDAYVTLKQLYQQGYSLGIISNWDNSLKNVLDRLGVTDFFSIIVHSTAAGFMKPDLQLFQTALDQVNVNMSNCWYLGDQIDVDIAPAQKLGMKTVLIDYFGKYEHTKVATYHASSLSLAAHFIINHEK